jgi:preprotein translocase subunit SecA
VEQSSTHRVEESPRHDAGKLESLNRTDRFGSQWKNQLVSWFGSPWDRRLAYAALQVPKIRHWESEFDKLTDFEILEISKKMKGRARGGESLDKMLPEAFGLASIASKRILGMRPFDVQLVAGAVIHGGALAELATGEGKTLVASLPAFLNGLAGKGVHVASVNDYLSRRDGEWLKPVYAALGMTTGILQQQMSVLIAKMLTSAI